MRVAKNELRQKMRDLRARLAPDEVKVRSAAAAAHALALPELAAAQRVALFAPIVDSNEIETAAIHDALVARGARVGYPRVRARGEPLSFHVVDDLDELAPSKLGIPQPAPAAPALGLDEIDVFIIPGLAFDRLGERLGWGAGHYDRTLARAPRALRVGYAYDFQVVARVPSGADDERIDVLVTESGSSRRPR